VKNRLLSLQQIVALFLVAFGVLALTNLANDARELHTLYQRVEILQQRRLALEAEIADLRSQKEALARPHWADEAARKWLHWTRPNEVLVVVTPSEPRGTSPATSADADDSNAPSHWQEWLAYLQGMNP
jgi:cell division protein FtsB